LTFGRNKLKRLLIRPGAIGDFILSLPALEALQSDYTEVWATSKNLALARFADRARPIVSTGLDLAGLPGVDPPVGLWEDLASFDSIISWYGTNRPEFRQAVAGLPFHFLTAVPAEGTGLHAADYYMRQAAEIVGRSREAIPRLDCPLGDGGYAAIHPFSGSPRKNWPLDRYQELGRLIERRMPVKWVVEGVRPDDLYELACWLARARVYIGNDSGITHLAAAAGTRVVALFGPTDPAVWAPRGPNVRIVAGAPMEAIEVDRVAAAALEGWEGSERCVER
jgi:heptosyltransferase-3